MAVLVFFLQVERLEREEIQTARSAELLKAGETRALDPEGLACKWAPGTADQCGRAEGQGQGQGAGEEGEGRMAVGAIAHVAPMNPCTAWRMQAQIEKEEKETKAKIQKELEAEKAKIQKQEKQAVDEARQAEREEKKAARDAEKLALKSKSDTDRLAAEERSEAAFNAATEKAENAILAAEKSSEEQLEKAFEKAGLYFFLRISLL